MKDFTLRKKFLDCKSGTSSLFKGFVMLVVLMLMTTSSAMAEVIDGIRYLLESDTKTATLLPKKEGKYSGDIIIPEKIKGNDGVEYVVTSLGESCFEDCRGLTSITIPSSVTSLGRFCFAYCSSLTSFHLPTKIRGVDYYAFEGCDNLTSMYVNWANLDDLAYYLKQNEDDMKENFDFFKGWSNGKSCTLFVPKGSYSFWTRKKYLHNWIVSFKNIKEYDVTGISHVKNSNNTKEIFRYSIDGKLLKATTKGINIVKYSNGTVKKIIVQ